jgi:Family of unknown function (DUF6521)
MGGVELSREERGLFNPAFAAVVCTRAVQGYTKEYDAACPLPIAVTAAVMAFQPFVRAALPATTGTGLMGWLDENEAVRVAMGRHADSLAAVVRPGILFALQSGVLRLDGTGLAAVARALSRTTIRGDTEQTIAIQKAAFLLGRWLPSTGSISTVLTLLGVQP